MASAADRQRDYRDRKREGKVIFIPGTYWDRAEIEDCLKAHGYEPEGDDWTDAELVETFRKVEALFVTHNVLSSDLVK